MTVFVVLGIQHAMRSRLIVFSSAVSVVLKYLSTLSHKGTIFGEKNMDYKICVLIFSTTFV
jgi:hypothetical protein